MVCQMIVSREGRRRDIRMPEIPKFWYPQEQRGAGKFNYNIPMLFEHLSFKRR